MRAAQLARQPLCEECLKVDRTTPATIAHHKHAHRGRQQMFFDAANLASVCKHCHDTTLHSEEMREASSG
jgi:5-methylcytosine-specific restriction endonuclease McrA